MTTNGPQRISIENALEALTFLPDRTPATTDEQAAHAFASLSAYRDGAIYVGHWAGRSEWERHPVGDEIVMVLEGETTMSFHSEAGEQSTPLTTGDLVVVPQGTWHRFDTAEAVKVLSVTPQPSDHRVDHPAD